MITQATKGREMIVSWGKGRVGKSWAVEWAARQQRPDGADPTPPIDQVVNDWLADMDKAVSKTDLRFLIP